jgi:hypothetical protein
MFDPDDIDPLDIFGDLGPQRHDSCRGHWGLLLIAPALLFIAAFAGLPEAYRDQSRGRLLPIPADHPGLRRGWRRVSLAMRRPGND